MGKDVRRLNMHECQVVMFQRCQGSINFCIEIGISRSGKTGIVYHLEFKHSPQAANRIAPGHERSTQTHPANDIGSTDK